MEEQQTPLSPLWYRNIFVNKHLFTLQLKSLKGMRLLLLSLFLLEESATSGKSHLVQTKDGKMFLAIGNPKDFTDGDSNWMNMSTETGTSDFKSKYHPRQLFSMESVCLSHGWVGSWEILFISLGLCWKQLNLKIANNKIEKGKIKTRKKEEEEEAGREKKRPTKNWKN